MAKIAVIFNTSQNKNTYRYEIDQLKVVDWSVVLGCCLWNTYMSRYENDPYMNVQSYPIWGEIKEFAEKELWAEVYKLGKKFTSKVVKAKDLEEHAECAIKSYMHTLNVDNPCCVIANGKAKDIMTRLSALINDNTNYDAYDVLRICMHGTTSSTIMSDNKKEGMKFIPCNNAYAYYNMENYYDELGFEVWDDYKLYEGKNTSKGTLKESVVYRSDVKTILDKAKELKCHKGLIEDLTAIYEVQSTSDDWEIIDICENYGEKELLKFVKELLGLKENKTMKKARLTEKKDFPSDWDYDEIIEEYGCEYLGETNPDVEPMDMGEFNELTSYKDDPLEAITRAFFGGRWGFKNDSFSPMDEYFAYDGYANLISIKDYDLVDYLKEKIDEGEFYDWCVDNGHFESDEDDE